MIEHPYIDLYYQDSVNKELRIEFDGGVITNDDLLQEEFELTESICSESQLRFGTCEASVLKFRVANIFTPLVGKWLTVSETLVDDTENPFVIGRYKVFSDKPTANRMFRDIVAYDAMYDIINADVTEWYKSRRFPDAMFMFRRTFFEFLGIEEASANLINDIMRIEKTIETDKVSGKDVITAICEVNGCFGHIGRDGKFHYVTLQEIEKGLYPGDDVFPSDDLFPKSSNAHSLEMEHYREAEYEDYEVAKIDKLQIRTNEEDVGCIIGEGDNAYIIQNNFLLFGKSQNELDAVAVKLFNMISKVSYRPFKGTFMGNPCLEVGDAIEFTTNQAIVQSYVLSRVLSGIIALKDNYSAEGSEVRTTEVNAIARDITLLKGKTNEIIHTIEENSSKIEDIEEETASQIQQLSNSISLKVSAGDVVSVINQSAEKISLKSNRLEIESDDMTLKDGQLKVNSGRIGDFVLVQGMLFGLKDGSGTVSIDNLNIKASYIKAFDTIESDLISCNQLSCTYLTVNGNSVITDGSQVSSLTVDDLYTKGSTRSLSARLSSINDRLKALEDAVGIS